MQSLGEKDNRIKTDDDIWRKEEEPMVNFCFKIIQFQQRLQCVMNCFQHLNQAERQGAQLSQRGMAVRRPQCVCVWLIVWLSVCSGKKTQEEAKWQTDKRAKKDFGKVSTNQKKFYTHSSSESGAVQNTSCQWFWFSSNRKWGSKASSCSPCICLR